MPDAMPAAREGLVSTLNQTGFTTEQADDPYTLAFVDFAARAPGQVLEIGAAYGVAALQVLKRNVPIIANDLDPRHLEIFKQRTPPELQPLLRLMPGRFPEEIDLAPNSLGAIFICRVMHYMSPAQITAAVDKMMSSLVPGGKVFAVVDTPYLKSLESYLPTYRKRKASGEEWPGWCENFKDVVIPEFRSVVPDAAHFLDEETFPQLFLRAGFRVEQSSFIPRPYYPAPVRLDGRESVGVIAVKP